MLAPPGVGACARTAKPRSLGTVAQESLRVTAGPAAGTEIPLDEVLLIGRAAPGQGRLAGDIELSREHARISRNAHGQIVVEDLGSTNGTYVNGWLMSEPVAVSPGDVVRVGASELQVIQPGVELYQPTMEVARPPQIQVPAAAGPTNTIEVENLVRQYKDGPRAVDGVSLYVGPGEVYGFLGPNGAGKSTTVHMLTTLLAPSAGVARVAGYDVATQGAQVRASIGVALQEAALDPVLTGWEHMELQTALQGVPKAERRQRAEYLLDRVALTEFADRRAGGYSGGMKRRLDLALALVHSPRVLFLDEPTTGLDPKSRNDLWVEVRRLAKEEGVTVFLTTQYLEEADMLADNVGIIDRGHLVAEGTPEALKAEIGRPTVEAVPQDESQRAAIAAVLERYGQASGAAHKGVAVQLARGADDLGEIARALQAEGLAVASLNLHAPTLDDVFLAKTGRSLDEEAQTAGTQFSAAMAAPPVIRADVGQPVQPHS
jgi:ABC-2 type transport system ATP-binding protein